MAVNILICFYLTCKIRHTSDVGYFKESMISLKS